MRVIFLGTPEFAVASLEAILKAGYDVVAVVTAPDKPAGRGMGIQQSAVKLKAIEKGIPVLQPEKLKDSSFLDRLKELRADIQVVVAFRMLPEAVWNMPPMGTINVHASLLPQYRGAAPINWAIIHGENVTGVTTFKLKHEIDTGNILMQRKVSIDADENVGSLYSRLMESGAELLVETLQGIERHSLKEIEQITQDKPLQHAPKITKAICQIQWEKSSEEIRNLIRGLSPNPGAFTYLKGKLFKIFSAELIDYKDTEMTGSLQTDNKTFLSVSCGKGWLSLKEVQMEGKKSMPIEEFLKGINISDQNRIGT